MNQPFGFFDFVKLEKNAMCIISDSGTVQEEACIFHVPSITIRKSTERRETIECGSNVLCGTNYNDIMNAFSIAIKSDNNWITPEDYIVYNVSDIIINILAGKNNIL
jgi:UDP-N-acetylglucosamine 2-epimerase (non-hydrolysing)